MRREIRNDAFFNRAEPRAGDDASGRVHPVGIRGIALYIFRGCGKELLPELSAISILGSAELSTTARICGYVMTGGGGGTVGRRMT